MKLCLDVRICSAIGRALCHLDDCSLRKGIGRKASLHGFVSLCCMDQKRPGLCIVLR